MLLLPVLREFDPLPAAEIVCESDGENAEDDDDAEDSEDEDEPISRRFLFGLPSSH